MGNKDIALKQFLSDNHRFAELFNNALFDGQEVVKPEKLKETNTAEAEVVALRNGAEEVIQKSRDIAKIYNDEVELVILGIENQQQVHFAMPMRVMVYDALSYERQYKEISSLHKKQNDLKGAERISGFAVSDKLIPIITLVVYYGAEAWNGPKDLHDMIAIPQRTDAFKQFIGNYPMQLLEVREIENLEAYKEDLMALFAFIKYQKKRNELMALINKHSKYFSAVSETTYLAIKNMVDIKEIDGYIEKQREKEGAINMCEALKEIREEGKIEGILKGRNEGRKEGRKEGRAESLQEVAKQLIKYNHPLPFIAEITHLSEKEIAKLKDQLEKN